MNTFHSKLIHTIKWEFIQLTFIIVYLSVSYFQELIVFKTFSSVGIHQRDAIQGYLNNIQFFLLPDFFYSLFPQVIIVSMGLILFKKWRWYFYAGSGIFIALLYMANRMYANFFASAISVSTITFDYFKHLWVVKPSLLKGVSPTDIGIILVFTIFIAFGIIYNRKLKHSTNENPTAFAIDKILGIFFFLLALHLYNVAFFLPNRYVILDDQNNLQISTRPFHHHNDYLQPNYQISSRYYASTFGMMNYHFYDFINWLAPPHENQTLQDADRVDITKMLIEKKALNDIKSPFWGIAENRNVFLLHFESVNPLLIGAHIDGIPVTPTLNEMSDTYLFWPNTLDQVRMAGSSDAEFMALTGMLPDTNRLVVFNIKIKDKLYSLPGSLRDAGYQTISLHGFDSSFWLRHINHPKFGIETMYFKNEFVNPKNDKLGLGIPDKDFFSQAADMLLKHDPPFFAYLITLSTHFPYDDVPEGYENLFLKENHEKSMISNYLQLIRYTDDSLNLFLSKMKKAGLWENSIFIIYGDHRPVLGNKAGDEKLMEFLGTSVSRERFNRVPIIIMIPGQENMIQKYKQEYCQVVGGQHDIYPTIMHLLGMETPLGIFGTHLFVSNEEKGPVPTLKDLDNFVYNGVLYKESGTMPCVDDQGLVFTGTPDTVIKDEAKRLSAHKKAFRAIRLSNTILRHNIDLRSLEDMNVEALQKKTLQN